MRRFLEWAFLPALAVACAMSVALGLGLIFLLPLELGGLTW